MVTPAEEQGFVGLRIDVEDTFTGGIFVGHGHMVLGLGPDVIEPLLSAVRIRPMALRRYATATCCAKPGACCLPKIASTTR